MTNVLKWLGRQLWPIDYPSILLGLLVGFTCAAVFGGAA